MTRRIAVRPLHAMALALALTGALSLAAPAPAGTPSAPSAGMIRMKMNDETLMGYLALPKGDGTHPGVIVIQEWWGVTDWVKEQTDSLAAHGYVALAVDLYDGKVAKDADTAHQYMSGLAEDAALAKLRRGVDFLRSRDDVRAQAIGVVGWCMGGRYSIRLAATEPGIRACVMYYGAPITDPAAIKAIQAPVLGNFGAADKGPAPDQVKAFEKALKEAGKQVDFKIYEGAGHAFANINNPWGGYREEAARDAWARTLAFFKRELSQASAPKLGK
ncbi:MAG TPA: dienelactone hydrolase family protein [Candidatus Eisenbacteria bacterium]|nr:dienelactone hydrolase family protein [Candidatus Eisenbacteria bacterium]